MRAFTLVEAVIVIAIMGILAGVVATFIRLPVQGYIDSAARAELTDIADLAMRRMARDLRLALPNSIVVASDQRSVSFLITKTGGRYLAEEDGVGGSVLSFSDPTLTTFGVVGVLPTGRQTILAGDYIVVNNLGPGYSPADAYAGQNRAVVASVNTASNQITLASNPFAAQNPVMASPTHRFHVVTGPVTYTCNNTAGAPAQVLTRIWGYPIPAAQTGATTGSPSQSALIASDLAACLFDYALPANQRSALVGLSITLQRPGSSDGPVNLRHQVHVDNTP